MEKFDNFKYMKNNEIDLEYQYFKNNSKNDIFKLINEHKKKIK